MAKKNSKTWEPEYKFESVTGQFVDYAGNTRDYTMVAVSVPADMIIANLSGFRCVEKVLTIGVAVRSAQDKDNGMGVRIAYGKALKKADHICAVTHAGMINTTMVEALLKQEAAYFEKNPGMYLAGYDKDAERFEQTGRTANAETPTPVPNVEPESKALLPGEQPGKKSKSHNMAHQSNKHES